MKVEPMPSPRGTNHERLFILRGRKPRGYAYDARPARDNSAEPGLTASNHHGPDPQSQSGGGGIEGIKAWLRSKLQPEDFARLDRMITARGAEDDESESDAVEQILSWARENMNPADCNRLAVRLLGSGTEDDLSDEVPSVVQFKDRAGKGQQPARQSDGTIGGYAPPPVELSKSRAGGPAMDSHHGFASLFREFPDIARIGQG
jgi:hypothetical protein